MTTTLDERGRRWASVGLAVTAVLVVLLVPFNLDVVFAITARNLATSPMDGVRVLTDVDSGGPLARFFRIAIYVMLGVGVLSAAALASVAALRSSAGYSLILAEAMALSALGLAGEFVLHPVLRGIEPVAALAPLATVASLGVLVFSMGRMLNFAAVFPHPLTDEELDAASRRWASRPNRNRAFGIPVGPRGSPEAQAKGARDAVRLAERWWLGPVAGTVVALVTLVDVMAGTMAFWWAFLAFFVTGYPLIRLRESIAQAGDRERLRWIVVGFHSSAWAFVVLTVTPFALGPLIGGVGYGIYMACVAGLAPFAVYLCLLASLFVAVFHRGDLDPTLALRRSTVLGVGLVLFVAVFGAVENLASEWIESRVGLSGFTGPMITGAVIAVALLPIQPFLRRLSVRIHPALSDAGARDPE